MTTDTVTLFKLGSEIIKAYGLIDKSLFDFKGKQIIQILNNGYTTRDISLNSAGISIGNCKPFKSKIELSDDAYEILPICDSMENLASLLFSDEYQGAKSRYRFRINNFGDYVREKIPEHKQEQ